MSPQDRLMLRIEMAKMLNKSYSQPMTATERVKGGASVLPVVGDAISGYDAYQSFKQGNYGEAALNAVGMLPMIPGLAGVIKKTGNIPSKGIQNIDEWADIAKGKKVPSSSNIYDSGLAYPYIGGLGDANMYPLKSGDYLSVFYKDKRYRMKSMNPFYAIGDNHEELAKYTLDRINRSEKILTNKSLYGKLKKEFGDIFKLERSSKSNSEYITHKPTGKTIRVSDHDLPGIYDQPTLDLRDTENMSDMINKIKEIIK